MSSVSLAEACDLITDGTHYTPPDIGTGVPFLTVKDVSPAGLDFDGCARISQADYDAADAGNSAPKLGDVLFSKDGTVGKVHVVQTAQPFAVLSSLAILRPSRHVDSKFLGHMLGTPEVLSQAVKRKSGSAIRRIILSDLREVELPLPPLDEQRRIAAILDHAAAIRTKRRQVIAHFDTLAGVYFFESFRSVQRKSRLRNVGVDFLSGKNVLASGLDSHATNRVIKVSAMSRGMFVASESKPMPAAYSPPESHRLRRGDILFGRASGSLDLLGATAIVDDDPEDLFLPDKVWRLTIQQDAPVVAKYVLGVLRSADARAFIRHNASGAAGVRNIGKAKLLEYLAPLPPLGLQYEYVSNVEVIERQRTTAARELEALDELFASLQARAFRAEL